MKEKNRFSGLLKHLMTTAKLKNYTLAKELQYDESYISKWVNGNLLPTEKTSDKILREISRCVVASLDDESRAALYSEYQVDHDRDLELAVYDNLTAEFNYVMDLKESTGSEVANETSFYPELTLSQFMMKMRHPVLRQVKALDVITAVDILSLDRSYQMSLAELQNAPNVNVSQRSYPGVHFSMLLNLDNAENNLVYNISFLLNLLTNLSNVNFQLYVCPQAQGKIIFSVRDAYCISGMIMDESHCMAVTTSEEQKHCNSIYDRLVSMCSQEMLAVRRSTMADMLSTKEYVQALFARGQRWGLGHVTEHFVPNELFDALAAEFCSVHREISFDRLRRAYLLAKSVVENMDIRILCYENALNEFAVTGTLDFFNMKIQLTPEQRLLCLNYAVSLYEKNPSIKLRIMRSGLISDIHHIPDPTVFLSDSLCHLRLIRSGPTNNLSIVNKKPVADLFRKFFDRIWNDETLVDKDPHFAGDIIRYACQMINVQIQLENQ